MTASKRSGTHIGFELLPILACLPICGALLTEMNDFLFGRIIKGKDCIITPSALAIPSVFVIMRCGDVLPARDTRTDSISKYTNRPPD